MKKRILFTFVFVLGLVAMWGSSTRTGYEVSKWHYAPYAGYGTDVQWSYAHPTFQGEDRRLPASE